jgi:uncharacterized membrane protein
MFIYCLIELDVATRLALLPKYERLYKFKILIVIFMRRLMSDSYIDVLLGLRAGLLSRAACLACFFSCIRVDRRCSVGQ